jgi:hypothetical protein
MTMRKLFTLAIGVLALAALAVWPAPTLAAVAVLLGAYSVSGFLGWRRDPRPPQAAVTDAPSRGSNS